MRNVKLLNNASRAFYKVGFQLKKHSPAILVVAGVAGVVTSTVMACKATLKVNTILEETKKQVDQIHEYANNEELKESGKYTEKDCKKDLTIVYTRTGLQLAKLYGPSVLLGTVSIVSILASYKILNTRNLALSAAYTVVDKSFKDYRKRVQERFGKRVDYELKHNIKAQTIETIDIDENGNEVTDVKTVDVTAYDPNDISEFAVFFDEYSPCWSKSAEQNRIFLQMQQAYANDKLKMQGYLYLNEVYEMLGVKKTKAGHVVGWVYDEKHPIGDNFVDFGIFDIHKKGCREFVNGYERSILLDFNVDGNVWELMP